MYTFCILHNDRDASIRGHCSSGTIHFGDRGCQKIRTGTYRFGTSHHPIVFTYHILVYIVRDRDRGLRSATFSEKSLNVWQVTFLYLEISLLATAHGIRSWRGCLKNLKIINAFRTYRILKMLFKQTLLKFWKVEFRPANIVTDYQSHNIKIFDNFLTVG